MHRPLFPCNCRYTVVLVVLLKLESRKTSFCAPQVLRVTRLRYVCVRYLVAQNPATEDRGNEEVDRRRCFPLANTEKIAYLKVKLRMRCLLPSSV